MCASELVFWNSGFAAGRNHIAWVLEVVWLCDCGLPPCPAEGVGLCMSRSQKGDAPRTCG